jgi:hypothetical protein
MTNRCYKGRRNKYQSSILESCYRYESSILDLNRPDLARPVGTEIAIVLDSEYCYIRLTRERPWKLEDGR